MMSVTAMSILQPPVSVFPNIVTLQPGPLPVPTAVPFRMFVNPQSLATNQTVQFTNPAVNLSNVTVNVLEESPGRMAAVTLTFPAGLYLAPGTPAEFTIQTTHPDMPVIKVPITQMAKQPVLSVPGAPGPIPAPAANPAGRSTQRPAAPVSAPPPSPPEIVLPGAPSSDK
jgi:hypothetical protein